MTTTIASVKHDLRYQAMDALLALHKRLPTKNLINRYLKAAAEEKRLAAACDAQRHLGKDRDWSLVDDYDYAADFAASLHQLLINTRGVQVCPACHAINSQPHRPDCRELLAANIERNLPR